MKPIPTTADEIADEVTDNPNVMFALIRAHDGIGFAVNHHPDHPVSKLEILGALEVVRSKIFEDISSGFSDLSKW